MPKDKRNFKEETIIKKRLKSHFGRHFLEKEKEILKTKKEGIIWFSLGALLLLGIIFVSLRFAGAFFASFMMLLEVPSWFLMWEGMDKIFLDVRKIEVDYIFYKKMASAEINFFEY